MSREKYGREGTSVVPVKAVVKPIVFEVVEGECAAFSGRALDGEGG